GLCLVFYHKPLFHQRQNEPFDSHLQIPNFYIALRHRAVFRFVHMVPAKDLRQIENKGTEVVCSIHTGSTINRSLSSIASNPTLVRRAKERQTSIAEILDSRTYPLRMECSTQ